METRTTQMTSWPKAEEYLQKKKKLKTTVPHWPMAEEYNKRKRQEVIDAKWKKLYETISNMDNNTHFDVFGYHRHPANPDAKKGWWYPSTELKPIESWPMAENYEFVSRENILE